MTPKIIGLIIALLGLATSAFALDERFKRYALGAIGGTALLTVLAFCVDLRSDGENIASKVSPPSNVLLAQSGRAIQTESGQFLATESGQLILTDDGRPISR